MTLNDFLNAHGFTNTAFAAVIGKSQGFVSRLRSGDAMPSLETLQAIQIATNGQVMPSDFVRRARASAKVNDLNLSTPIPTRGALT